MKILRINICNLNALRGERTIDFTRPPLSEHQLYAITGPTGAGKTTILDAITLALYGHTERNRHEKDRKDGAASVMTYGTGECWAQVEYQTAQGIFRNTWRRQRAHKRPDRDLTKSTREISRWNPESGEWDILAAGKKREVAAATVAAVGLDYDRFVRSVMLTQGDFARFLRSDAGEKAAILEKITGTEIYRDLSMAAYARAKQARADWQRVVDALALSPPLPEESRRVLEAQHQAKEAAAQQLAKELLELSRQLERYEQLHRLQAQQQAVEAQLAELEKRWVAQRSEREKLALNDRLEPGRETLLRWQQLEEELGTLTKRQTALTARLAAQQAQQETLAQAVDRARVQQEDFAEKLPEREAKIAQAAVLETRLAELERDRLAAVNQQREEAKQQAQLSSALAPLEEQIRPLAEQLAGRDAAAIEAECDQQAKALAALEAEMRTVAQQVTAAQLTDRLGAAQTAATEAAQQVAVAQQTAETAAAALLRDQQAADEALLRWRGLEVSASLHDHKARLQPGEACPVCGATEHPALATYEPVTASRVAAAQAACTAAQAAAKKQAAAVQTATAQAQQRDRQAAEAAVRVEALARQLAELGVVPPAGAGPAQLAAQQAALTARAAAQRKTLDHWQALRRQLPGFSAAQARREQLRLQQQQLTTARTTTEQQLQQLVAQIKAQQAARQALVGKHSVAECRQLLEQRAEHLRAAQAAAVTAQQAQAAVLAETTGEQKQLAADIARRAAAQAEVAAAGAAQLADWQLSRAEALAGLLPATTVQGLRQALQALTQERHTATARRAELTAAVAAATAATAELPPAPALQARKGDLTERQRLVNREIGALEEQRQQDDRKRQVQQEREAELVSLRAEADRWERMNQLIGSADGKKFRSSAQAITLQQLILTGNDHLANISPRYRMEYERPAAGMPERLEMVIIDQYQNDNRRTMATLSGGESFLVSLALALGLSDLASGRQLMQSLFIDEGFGTLDGKTLDQAMRTLEQLRAQGKTIGLISHVPQLQERIQCQLKLRRVAEGFSTIDIKG